MWIIMDWRTAYANNPSGKVCAFCKYWYDPANAAIRPKQIRSGRWEYDRDAESVCMNCKFNRHAWQHCNKFESKV